MEAIKNKYDFILLFDVEDGNPNGDPDAGNLPRIDAETGRGLVTDVCLKRKIRNYIQAKKHLESGFDIFIKEKAILIDAIDKMHDNSSVKDIKDKAAKTEAVRKLMCREYYDIRTFGAVMSFGKNAGQVRGPIQMTFARSIDSITTEEHTITRMAVTNAKDASEIGDNRTMGRKATVPYGLYLSHGFISANLAQQVGFSEDDLSLFWEALLNMFDNDHSAARGLMSVRKLIVFKHDSELGNAPASQLFDLVSVERIDNCKPARNYSDYKVSINKEGLPKGVQMQELL